MNLFTVYMYQWITSKLKWSLFFKQIILLKEIRMNLIGNILNRPTLQKEIYFIAIAMFSVKVS